MRTGCWEPAGIRLAQRFRALALPAGLPIAPAQPKLAASCALAFQAAEWPPNRQAERNCAACRLLLAAIPGSGAPQLQGAAQLAARPGSLQCGAQLAAACRG